MPETTLSIAPEHFWLMAGLLGLLVLSGLVYAVLALVGGGGRRFWWDDIPEGWRWLAILLGLVWLGLFGLTVMAAYAGVWQMIHPKGESGGAASGLGFGALLAAMLGAPFVIWGTVIKHKTLALSETSLFNDKVNAAVAALHSRRQVTREIAVDGEAKILTEWQDDIVQRSAAIDRLEGLMRERPSEAPRIVNMLSVYIRELSREFPAKEHPRTKWLVLIEPEDGSALLDEGQALSQLGLTPDDVTVEALTRWARQLRPFRTDVEKAAQTLGRVRDIADVVKADITIDLRGMIAQGFDLEALDFSEAKLNAARMEGANLCEARVEGTDFSEARMEGTNFSEARMKGANLFAARMEGAVFRSANMEGADLSEARMEGADLAFATMEAAVLRKARLREANFSWAMMEEVDLSDAGLERADLSYATLDNVNFFGARLKGAYVHGAWLRDAKLINANLEWVNFTEVDLEGANLSGAQMDSATNLSSTKLYAAAVKAIDCRDVRLSQEQINQMFGDGSVTLPQGLTRPAHWPEQRLDWSAFLTEWREWQEDAEGYRPPSAREAE